MYTQTLLLLYCENFCGFYLVCTCTYSHTQVHTHTHARTHVRTHVIPATVHYIHTYHIVHLHRHLHFIVTVLNGLLEHLLNGPQLLSSLTLTHLPHLLTVLLRAPIDLCLDVLSLLVQCPHHCEVPLELYAYTHYIICKCPDWLMVWGLYANKQYLCTSHYLINLLRLKGPLLHSLGVSLNYIIYIAIHWGVCGRAPDCLCKLHLYISPPHGI